MTTANNLLSEIIQDANSLKHLTRDGDLLLQRIAVFVEHLMEGRR